MESSPLIFIAAFLLTSFVSSLVMTAVRVEAPALVARETVRLFLTIAGGILIFSLVVWILESVFIRPLV
jgi:hypothetical protein